MARRSLTAILFTDIVDSTRRAAELGDAEWRKILAAHHARFSRVAEVGQRLAALGMAPRD